MIPAVNQGELHPYFTQPVVQRANADLGVVTQTWSPVGGITFYPGWGDNCPSVLAEETLNRIVADHERTPAQIMLRWQLEQGRSAILKSTTPQRIAQNFDVFDFTLNEQELTTIDARDRGVRGGPDPDEVDPSTWDLTFPEPDSAVPSHYRP